MDALNSLFLKQGGAPESSFSHSGLDSHPIAARNYLQHAIIDKAPLASAVHLRMNGEIKLKGWLPFTAEQVVHIDLGFIWKARVKSGIMTISGFDQYLDGAGECKWKLFGLISVMAADGPDISRSSQGRYAIEQVLLPSALCRETSTWTGSEHQAICTSEAGPISLSIAESGELESVSMDRWGNPGGGAFRLERFGALVEEEATFGDYTLPSKLRVGWGIGSPAFDDGEFSDAPSPPPSLSLRRILRGKV